MKNFVVSAVLVVSTLLLVPLWALNGEGTVKVAAGMVINDTAPQKATFHDSFKLQLHESGQIIDISAHDYIIGVVAAEMPALYEEEALKAQAVAAYTFACYRRDTTKEAFHVSTDPTTCQSYADTATLKERWGENYDGYYNKIKSAVQAVEGQLLCYEGKTALSVYHAISSGKTNPSLDVWGKDIPYLKSVDSIGDKLSKDYISAPTFTRDELCERLGVTGDSFDDIKKTSTSLVKSVTFGGKSFSGAEIQKALSLRSAAFDVAVQNGVFTFTVYGYGHGVGMSQNGADYMAKQGSSYTEILAAYYPGCQIIKGS